MAACVLPTVTQSRPTCSAQIRASVLPNWVFRNTVNTVQLGREKIIKPIQETDLLQSAIQLESVSKNNFVGSFNKYRQINIPAIIFIVCVLQLIYQMCLSFSRIRRWVKQKKTRLYWRLLKHILVILFVWEHLFLFSGHTDTFCVQRFPSKFNLEAVTCTFLMSVEQHTSLSDSFLAIHTSSFGERPRYHNHNRSSCILNRMSTLLGIPEIFHLHQTAVNEKPSQHYDNA